jgi:hypothetical protein
MAVFILKISVWVMLYRNFVKLSLSVFQYSQIQCFRNRKDWEGSCALSSFDKQSNARTFGKLNLLGC